MLRISSLPIADEPTYLLLTWRIQDPASMQGGNISRMSIVVVGSVGIDFVAVAPRLPKVGETVLADRPLHIGPGGKGFNQAVGVARLGGDVRFATKTGSRDLGRQAQAFLEAEGLLGPLVKQSDRDNQVALIFVDETGRNMISVTPGASAAVGTRIGQGTHRHTVPVPETPDFQVDCLVVGPVRLDG